MSLAAFEPQGCDKMLKALLISTFIFGCSQPKQKTAPSMSEETKYNEINSRLVNFLDQDFVVSHGADNHHGDSLLFTGLAAYSLPCAAGAQVASGLATMVLSGAYYRYPGDTDPVSMDQLLGLYRGVAARVRRCNEGGRWKAAFNVAPADGLPAGFDFVRRKLMAMLELAGDPPASLQAEMEASAVAWTVATNVVHAPCYRAHLSLIALQTIEEMGGKISSEGRTAFCDAARGMEIATIEHWCGRQDLSTALAAFKYNEYEYHWQRGAWELPDGNGLETPAVDYLVAYMDKTGGR